MRKSLMRWSALVAFALVAEAGQAALVDAPLPSNAYISHGGLDWAWAAAVAGDGSFVDLSGAGVPGAFTGVDLSYQGQFGWRLATAAELENAPDAFDFIFEGANVPSSGRDPVSGAFNFVTPGTTPDVARPGALACAVPYFSAWSRPCNWVNGEGSGSSLSEPWWQPGGKPWAETLVVRSVAVVPEPGTYALMLGGLGAIALSTRRRSRG